MRAPVSWADLRDAQVGVWGVGIEGRATLRRLAQLGVRPVVVVDDAPPGDAVEGSAVMATSPEALAALGACSHVVKSPGISRHGDAARTVQAGGALLVGGLGLWLEEADGSRVACVTGTKGKSTTASIAGALADGLGAACFVGGNIGLPPFDPAAPADVDFWIIETSSFQAADLTCSPEVVVVSSLFEDHLDWHGDLDTYVADKLSVCSQRGARVTVANGDDERLRARRNLLGPEVEWVSLPEVVPVWVERLGLVGRHNHLNALLARRALVELGVPGADDDDALVEAATGFTGLEHRLQPIGAVAGVRFVDDSLATNVLPTTAALASFAGERVALLVGGHDRGVDYRPLATAVADFEGELLVLTMPDSGSRIADVLQGVPFEVRSCPDLDAAVAAGFAWAGSGGVVLLSPAAPSFGRFRDYADRAEAFRAAMATCGEVTPP